MASFWVDPQAAKTLHVFRRAADARGFNPPAASGQASFAALPFAWLAADAPAPPSSLLSARWPAYATDRARLLMGIDWLVASAGGIDVLNLSLGPAAGRFDRHDPLQIATRFAHDQGVVVVVAAGNEGPLPGTLQPLAQAPWVVAVGASDASGERLLDSSSRGRRGGRGPAVVARGLPEVVVIGLPEPGMGTSFAAGRVSRLALWTRKCLDLLLGNLQDAGADGWSAHSRPVRLPVLGLADSGVDPRALDPLPPEVKAALDAGHESVRWPRDERQRQWLRRWLAATAAADAGVPPPAAANPGLVARALRLMARPLPGVRRSEAGAGFVDTPQLVDFFSSLTPGRLALLLCPAMTGAQRDTLARTLDAELGPLWPAAEVRQMRTWFLLGHRLAVARVV